MKCESKTIYVSPAPWYRHLIREYFKGPGQKRQLKSLDPKLGKWLDNLPAGANADHITVIDHGKDAQMTIKWGVAMPTSVDATTAKRRGRHEN